MVGGAQLVHRNWGRTRRTGAVHLHRHVWHRHARHESLVIAAPVSPALAWVARLDARADGTGVIRRLCDRGLLRICRVLLLPLLSLWPVVGPAQARASASHGHADGTPGSSLFDDRLRAPAGRPGRGPRRGRLTSR